MADSKQTSVLIVGAGPVGLLLACDLVRRGVGVRIIDKLAEPSPLLRAVGVASRTLEIFEDLGVLEEALAAGMRATHSRAYVNGTETMAARIDQFEAPFPYTLHLAQPETERILTELLARQGVHVERGCGLLRLEQTSDQVKVGLLRGDQTAEQAEYPFVVGCDGAHSTVRKQLKLPFEGTAYPIDLMLADALIDWPVPHDGISRMYGADGFLVAVTVPDEKRFRVSGSVSALHVEAGEPVVDAAEPITISERPPLGVAEVEEFIRTRAGIAAKVEKLIWTSYFRISLRQVPQYRVGRVFLAGDAGHIHPPTGGQGMNTGMQDAYNLGWKLALALEGAAAPALLDSYHAERHPVGADTLKRTHEASMQFLQPPTDPSADEKAALVNSMLFINYRGSPVVGPTTAVVPPSITGGDPQPGDRAPDARVVESATGQERRLFELFRGTKHSLLLYADKPGDKDALRRVTEMASALRARRGAHIAVHVIVPGDAALPPKSGPVFLDRAGDVRRAYGPPNLFLIRPDKYIGYRSATVEGPALNAHLRGIFG